MSEELWEKYNGKGFAAKYSDYAERASKDEDGNDIKTSLAGKQDTISDLTAIRDGAAAGSTAYQKPTGGIPDTDLSPDVRASLQKADTAIQDVSGKADKDTTATPNNLAQFDANGNPVDSGIAASVISGKANVSEMAITPDAQDNTIANIQLQTGLDTNVVVAHQSLSGYWNGSITPSGSGNVVSDITVDQNGQVTVTKSSAGVPNDGALNITVGSAATQTFTADQANGSPVNVTIPLASHDASGYHEGMLSTALAEQLDTAVQPGDLANYTQKVVPALAGNLATLTATGELGDSGYAANDFATAAQGALADTAVQPATLSDYVMKDGSKVLSTNDYTNADKDIVDQVGDAMPSGASNINPLVTNTDLQQAIANFGGFEVVSLTSGANPHPDVQNPSDKIIYLTKDSQSSALDPYTEWIYQNSSWEIIGETSVDLTGYITSVSMAGGTAISPVSGSSTIDLPAATMNSGTGVAGIMSGADKKKLEGIATGAEVNAIASISLNGAALAPDGNRNVEITISSPSPSSANPAMDGTAAPGVSTDYARADHVHPSDTSKQDVITFNTAYDPVSNKAATMSDISGTIAGKADKVSGAPSGNLAALDGNGNLVDSTVKPSDFKTKQTAVVDPTASGNAVSFIDTISQDTNGEITVTKKTVQNATASTSGVGGNAGLLSATDKETIDSLVTVATTGDYNDLTNKPTIPAAQVNSDWDASSGVAEILHKPTIGDGTLSITVGSASAQTFTANQETSESVIIPLADVDTSGATPVYTEGLMSASDKEKLDGIEAGAEANVKPDWNAAAGADNEILNKPSVGDGTLSITVGSAAVQTFTANQNTNESITIPLAAVDSTGSTPVYTEGLMSAADKAKVEGIADKADKVTSATPNNFASLTSGGNLADSGYSANSFATAAQGDLADSSIQGVTVDNGSPLTPVSGVVNIDLSGKVDVVSGKGLSTNDYTTADKNIVTKAGEVIPSDARSDNQLVSENTLTAAIADFGGFKISSGAGVDNHPDESNPNTRTVYLVKDTSVVGADKYNEWICTNVSGPTWEKIGDTTLDLSGYVEYPSTHVDTHIVAFGPNSTIVDTGTTVSALTNTVETVSIGAGSAISPTTGTTDINIPLAANNNGTGSDGAMSGTDKLKLDGIDTGAQVNTVNTVSIGAGSTISPTTGTTNIVIPLANSSSDGAMSSADKSKLDGIAVGAEVNAVNTVSIGAGSAISPTAGTTNINIPIATSSNDGAMSSTDKSKLDGIAAGAEPNVQSDWSETDTTVDTYIANKPDIIIPLDSSAALGGISAPKYLMVVTSMPPAAQIDPDTIYLVQGTYIGT